MSGRYDGGLPCNYTEVAYAVLLLPLPVCLSVLNQGYVAIAGNASDLPSFTPEESAMLKGSVDYQGINHYTTGVRMTTRCEVDRPA